MKSFIKKIIPPSFITKLQNVISKIDNIIMPFFAKSGFLSSIYFCFFSSKFHREHKAILQGRIEYSNSLNNIEQSSILLRRNIHRLEKGLIMRPRRDVFAEAYIEETLECYSKCLQVVNLCSKELKWAYDVLTKYFDVTTSSKVIDKARVVFYSLDHKVTLKDAFSLPYRYSERVTSNITTDQLHSLFKQRRSIRWYQDKKVDLSSIEKAIELASLAPSACNRQPFKFHIITDQTLASDVASIPMGTVGFSDNIPALIAIVGDLSAYPAERDRHVIYIDGGLVAMQLMLALETLGLSSCSINWPDIESLEKKMSNKLGLDFYQRPIMFMAVGYADPEGEIPFSQKKSTDLLIKEVI